MRKEENKRFILYHIADKRFRERLNEYQAREDLTWKD
jgi:hypothetical protein